MKGIVLAGGSGSRLWPLSRQHLPKQFLSLNGPISLLDSTVQRLHPLIQSDDVWIVTGENLATGEAFDCLQKYKQILEPVGRNTAPAIALAAALLQEENSDGSISDPVMLVLPADHVIKNKEEFQHLLKVAKHASEAGSLVTFGIRPTLPDTGFGYIEAIDPVFDESGDQAGHILKVNRFTEKPDIKTAETFVSSGNYYWNSGMFVWRTSTILREVREYLPEIYKLVAEMRACWRGGEPWQEVVLREFHRMPDISIDYGVLEHSSRVNLIPCNVGWSDVGSWDAMYDISIKDSDGNATDGNVLSIDCKNSLLRSQDRLLAAVGLEDIIAVETADAILLAKRGDSQRVREIVDTLKLRGGTEHIEHLTVKRPWGSYTVLENHAEGYKLKRIEVRQGARLSLQAHQHRSEHWVVVSGTATVTCGDEIFTVSKNESAYIPIGKKHRLENRGKIPLQMIEVQVGDYLGEDDIERFEDTYGRVK